MPGFILIIVSSFFTEISDAIGKQKLKHHQVSLYTTGFLMLFFGFVFLLIYTFWTGDFRFSWQSSPTFFSRAIIEIFLSWITIKALAEANRSTFSFIRTLTIPLLLIVDLVLGYMMSPRQIIGIMIITLVIAVYVKLSFKLEKKGIGLLFLSAFLPVVTISLYKYDITHFNSVEAEQILTSIILLIFFFLMAIFKAQENPFKFMLRPVFLLQSASHGLGSVLGSFAYLFLTPSVAVAILRSSSVFFAMLSGGFYFKEKSLLLKTLIAIGIIIGLGFLAS